MHPRTRNALQQLEDASWFTRVGQGTSPNVIHLSSWQEAFAHCVAEDWRALCDEAPNQFRARLLERDAEALRDWNPRVREAKQLTKPLVLRKTGQVVAEHGFPRSFIDAIHWDVLHLVLESEYADVYPPGFFAAQAYWYVQGHFPCGWAGEFPAGKLVIY